MAFGPEPEFTEELGVVEWDTVTTKTLDEAIKLRGKVVESIAS